MAKHRAGDMPSRSEQTAPQGTKYPTRVETSDAGRTAPLVGKPAPADQAEARDGAGSPWS